MMLSFVYRYLPEICLLSSRSDTKPHNMVHVSWQYYDISYNHSIIFYFNVQFKKSTYHFNKITGFKITENTIYIELEKTINIQHQGNISYGIINHTFPSQQTYWILENLYFSLIVNIILIRRKNVKYLQLSMVYNKLITSNYPIV